jgi:NRAMP (natural resistance-associated macrophage protein)-like metal ion transporter
MWRVTIGSTSFDDCRRRSFDAAASFHTSGHADVAEIGQAYELLSPLLGLGIASTLFAIALLASGLNSTVTATLAGQIVMEGFLRLRLPNWARRLVTRGIAIVPVVVVTALRLQSGHPVDAVAICGHPAGAVCLGSAKDG